MSHGAFYNHHNHKNEDKVPNQEIELRTDSDIDTAHCDLPKFPDANQKDLDAKKVAADENKRTLVKAQVVLNRQQHSARALGILEEMKVILQTIQNNSVILESEDSRKKIFQSLYTASQNFQMMLPEVTKSICQGCSGTGEATSYYGEVCMHWDCSGTGIKNLDLRYY